MRIYYIEEPNGLDFRPRVMYLYLFTYFLTPTFITAESRLNDCRFSEDLENLEPRFSEVFSEFS